MQRILVIRLSAMGDVAMTVPVLTQLLDQHPQVHIDVLTRSSFGPIFPIHARLHLIHPKLHTKHKGLLGLWRLSRELRKNKYDGICDLHDVLRSQILRLFFTLAGIRISKINKGRAEKNRLTRRKNKDLKQLDTTHSRYVQAFEKLGFTFELNENKKLIRESQVQQRIGLAPFAAHREKMWPLQKSQILIDTLLELYEGELLLFGGGQEEIKILEDLAHKSERIISTANQSLEKQIEYMSTLRVLISMDSANMHLASNLGIPVISIWGATHPYAGFLGFGQSMSNCIQRDNLDCRPCSVFGNKTCWRGDWACMDIDVEEVLLKLKTY